MLLMDIVKRSNVVKKRFLNNLIPGQCFIVGHSSSLETLWMVLNQDTIEEDCGNNLLWAVCVLTGRVEALERKFEIVVCVTETVYHPDTTD